MNSLRDMPNIGEVLAAELESAGIGTPAELVKAGSAVALFRIRGVSGRGCMNMLYALEGAIKNTRWHNLTREEKDKVKQEFEALASPLKS